MTLKIVGQAMIDERCNVRLCAPGKDGRFVVSAVAGNGMVLAIGYGETLEMAVRDMLTDLGVLEEEELCAIA